MINAVKREPIKIYLCDDQKEHIKQIVDVFLSMAEEYPTQIEYFLSAEELLKQLEKNEKEEHKLPNLILLDIEMPEENGISIGTKIKQQYQDIYLVFVTAFAEYAIKGYEADAFRYLLKPITKSNLIKLLIDFETEENKKKKIVIKTQNGERFLAIQDIIYISAEDKYTVIYEKKECYISDVSLKTYEEQLEKFGFFRIHRKYLVNMYHHKAMDGNRIILSQENSLPISVRKVAVYRNKLFSCMKENLL